MIKSTLNPFSNKPWFLRVLQYKSFESTVGKGEIAHNEQFLLYLPGFILERALAPLAHIFHK